MYNKGRFYDLHERRRPDESRDRKQCAAVVGQSVLCGVESVLLDHKKLSDGEARLDLPDAGLDIGAAVLRCDDEPVPGQAGPAGVLDGPYQQFFQLFSRRADAAVFSLLHLCNAPDAGRKRSPQAGEGGAGHLLCGPCTGDRIAVHRAVLYVRCVQCLPPHCRVSHFHDCSDGGHGAGRQPAAAIPGAHQPGHVSGDGVLSGAAAARDLDPNRALRPGAGRSGHRRCDGPDVPGLHQGAE